MLIEFVFGGVVERIFGWYFICVYDEVRYWEVKLKIFNNELVYLERRLGYFVDEIEVVKVVMVLVVK